MNFHSPFLFPKRLNATALAAMAVAFFTQSALACGPWFPNSYYASPTSQFLAAPDGSFYDELLRLLPQGAIRPGVWHDDYEKTRTTTFAKDVEDLVAALRADKRTEAEVKTLVAAYGVARRENDEPRFDEDGKPKTKPVVIPKGLPEEFALYFRGAIAWRSMDVDGARVAWKELLALPEAERKYRSTWAAYMIGRSYSEPLSDPKWRGSDQDVDDMVEWFRLTKIMASTGFADSLGLATEFTGWAAKAELLKGNHEAAINLYFQQLSTGDSSAIMSLRVTAAKLVGSYYYVGRYENSVKDPLTCSVVLAYLISKGGTVYERLDDVSEERAANTWETTARNWALAVYRSGQTNVRGADRLAWLAYEGGLFQLAKDWLAVAGEGSAEANWLRAKLALRDGKLEVAESFLEAALALKSLSVTHAAEVNAELGRVRLARDHPMDALGAWMDGGHREDSAYVAERVLTLDELVRVVDSRAPKLPSANPPVKVASEDSVDVTAGYFGPTPNIEEWLRALLARRFARVGRHESALTYFPEAERELYARYLTDVKTGFDVSKPIDERAAAFWSAAQLIESKGIQLLGTELYPDGAIYRGHYPVDDTRIADRLSALEGGHLAPTPDEAKRLAENRMPSRRYHYEARAMELAGWAASLMPNDNDATANVLVTAGRWVKAKHPQEARPFYQALVIRCGNTALGKEAAKLHWFPPLPDPVEVPPTLASEPVTAASANGNPRSAPTGSASAVNPDAKQ